MTHDFGPTHVPSDMSDALHSPPSPSEKGGEVAQSAPVPGGEVRPVQYFSRFMTLPTRVLRDVASGILDPLALAVMGALSSHIPDTGAGDEWVFCGLDRIGLMIGRSSSTAGRMVRQLEELGYIERQMRGFPGGGKGRAKTLYRLILDPPRCAPIAQTPDMTFEPAENGAAQKPDMTFEPVDKGGSNVKRGGSNVKRGGSNVTLGDGEIEILNKKAREGARASPRARESTEVDNLPGAGSQELSDFLNQLARLGKAKAAGKWLAAGSVGFREGDLLVASAFQADRVRVEFAGELIDFGRTLGLDRAVRVRVWRGEAS